MRLIKVLHHLLHVHMHFSMSLMEAHARGNNGASDYLEKSGEKAQNPPPLMAAPPLHRVSPVVVSVMQTL